MKKFLFIVLSITFLKGFSQEDPQSLLLKDFRPESIYNLPVTRVEKARFPVIDMHSHPYPESIGALDRWVRTMDETGIRKSIILTYAYGAAFDSLVSVYSRYPDRFELWCGFDYRGYESSAFPESAIRELKRCRQMGARGVGELGDKGKGLFYSKPPAWGMHPDDDRMAPLFAACAAMDMPVNLHVADPKWMYEPMDHTNDGLMNAYKWRLDDQEGITGHEGMIRILENTLKKNPETVFIACHFANCTYDLNIIGRLLENYDNLYVDISARFAEFSPIPRTAAGFFIKHQDKILYGTDMGQATDMYQLTFRILETADEHFYAHQHSSYHWSMHGLHLPDTVLEKIYFRNAEKIIQR